MIIDNAQIMDPADVEPTIANALNESDASHREAPDVDTLDHSLLADAESPRWWLSYETDVGFLKSLYRRTTDTDFQSVIRRRMAELDVTEPFDEHEQTTLDEF